MSAATRRDLAWLLAALVLGVLVLPPLVYATGVRVLGPYASGGLVAFMGDFFLSLAMLQPAAWILALVPAAVVAVWRGLLRAASALERGATA